MTDSKISGLPETTGVNDSDLDTIVQGGINKRIQNVNSLKKILNDRGVIAIAADFPTLVNVKVGWLYRFSAAVTDNDVTKTNTGLSFIVGDESYWNGITWEILGKAEASAAQSNAENYADGKFYPKGAYTTGTIPVANGLGQLGQSTIGESNKAWIDEAGNDTTGIIGSIAMPFATYDGASSTLTGTNSNRYLMYYSPGQHTETTLVLKPYIFAAGDMVQTTRVTISSGHVVPDVSMSTNNSRTGFENFYLSGSTGINLDLRVLSGYSGSQSAVFDFSICWVNGAVNCTGRTYGGSAAGADEFDFWDGVYFGLVTIDGGAVNSDDAIFQGGLILNATVANTNASFDTASINNLTVSGNTSGVINSTTLSCCETSGTLTIDGIHSTLTTDVISLSGFSSIVYTNGATSAQLIIIPLPNGTTTTTQSPGDNSTKLATTAYVDTKAPYLAGSNAIYWGEGGNDNNNGLTWGTRRLTFPSAYTLSQTAFGTPSSTNRVACICFDAGYYGSGGSSAINLGLTQYIDIYAPEATLAYSIFDPSGNRSINAKIIGASDLTTHTIYFNNSNQIYITAERIIANPSYFGISITGSAQPTLYIDVKNCDSFRDNNSSSIAYVYARFEYVGSITLSPVTVGSIYCNNNPTITANGNIACTIFCPNYVKSGHMIYVDGNRTDTYIPNGTEIMPYKTLSDAVAAMGSPTVGFALYLATGTYSEASAVTMPNVPITLYGNNSTITFAAGITFPNANYSRYDLNTIGNVVFSSTSVGRIIFQGGSITGNLTLNGSLVDAKSISLLSGVITVNAAAQLLLIACTVTSTITGSGIIFLEDINMNTSKSGYLVTSTIGGTLAVANCLITNGGTGGAISCDNGADGTTRVNIVANNFIATASGVSVATGTSKTIYSKNTVTVSPTGTGYMPVNTDITGAGNIMALGSDATGDMYYRAATALLTRIAPNSTVTKMFLSQTSSGAPAWGTVTSTDVGLSNVTNDTQTKAAIVPNTLPTAGQILVGNAGGTAYAPVSMSSDATLASTGAITIANNAVTNAKAAQVGANTYKGNATGSTANVSDVSTNTAFNQSFETSTSNIKMDGSVSVGALSTIARADHIHPSDTSRAPYLASSQCIYFGKGGNDSNNGLSWETRLLTVTAAWTLAATAFGTPSSTNVITLCCYDAGEYALGDFIVPAGYVYLNAPNAHFSGQIISTALLITSWINVRSLDQIGVFNGSTYYIKANSLGTLVFPIGYYCVYYVDLDYLGNFTDGTGGANPEVYGRIGVLNASTITARMVGDLIIGRSTNPIVNPSTTLSIRCGYDAGQKYELDYYNSAGVTKKLAPNTTIIPKFLQMVGDGTNGAAPTWKEQQTYNSIFVTRFGTDNTEAHVTNYLNTTGTGWINVAADFPTLAAVVDKGCYVVPSGVTITDNDATKTNTGMSFTGPLQISWDATNTKWIRRTGKTIQDPICSIAVASYLNYYYGATYGMVCLDAATYNFVDQFTFYGSLHAPLATLNSTGYQIITTTTSLSLYFDKMTTTPSDGFGSGGILMSGSGDAYVQCNSAIPLSSGSPTKMFSITAGTLTVIANTIRNTNTTDYTIYSNGGSVWVNANRMRGELYANSGTIYCTSTIASSITIGGAGTIYLNNKLIQSVSVSTWVCAATNSVPTTIILLSKDMATNTVTMSLRYWVAAGNSSTAGSIAATGVIPAAFRPTVVSVIGAIAAFDTSGIYSDIGSWGSAVIDTSGNISIMKTAAYPITGDWNPGTNNFGFYNSTIQWNTAQ